LQALIENLHRKRVSPIDIVAALKKDKQWKDLTQRQIADKLQLEESTVSNWHRVYHEEYLRKKIEDKQIGFDAGVEPLKVRPPDDASTEKKDAWKALGRPKAQGGVHTT
jgi:ParB-like chromosome segregation protein Spo0J